MSFFTNIAKLFKGAQHLAKINLHEVISFKDSYGRHHHGIVCGIVDASNRGKGTILTIAERNGLTHHRREEIYGLKRI